MTLTTKCFSARQLSPFVGNIQIVEADYCRALSSDGIHWQIQASCETHQQVWNISNEDYIPRRHVLYGSWNQSQGFSSLPLDPMLDVPSLDHVKSTLINTLQNCADQLPFQQADFYECWLMDKSDSMPLALLSSATAENMIPHIQNKSWQALPQQDKLTSLPESLTLSDITELENDINQPRHKPAWFHRQNDGSGILVSDKTRHLSASDFPQLLFNSCLLNSSLQNIADSLINWQAPRLLSLHGLSEQTRQQLELATQFYALETRKRLTIYPQPLKQSILNKILVELMIRGH